MVPLTAIASFLKDRGAILQVKREEIKEKYRRELTQVRVRTPADHVASGTDLKRRTFQSWKLGQMERLEGRRKRFER